jgi:hypothetical protein
MHAFAKIFGGRASLTGYFSILAYCSLPQFLMIIPAPDFLFILATIFYLIVATKRAQGLSRFKALCVVLAATLVLYGLGELLHF